MARDRGPRHKEARRSFRARDRKRTVHVYVEGIYSERMYMLAWKRRVDDTVNVHIDYRFAGQIDRLVRAAIDDATRQRVLALSDGDTYHIWCLLDTEGDVQRVRLIADAGRAGVKVAWSTPCIEAWFVLHRRACSWGLTASRMKSEFESVFGRRWDDLDPILPELQETWEDARDRAQALDRQHESGTSDGSMPEPADRNPGSNVWELIEAITQGSTERS